MTKISMYTISGTTAADGTLTAYTTNVAHGNIKAVKVTYDATADATTDLVLSDNNGQTILTLTDINTTPCTLR